MLKEVKEKIKLINKQLKGGHAGPISIMGQGGVQAEAADIIEESAYDSNGEAPMNPVNHQQQYNIANVQPHLQHQVAVKKKKSSSKGTKKKSGQ